MVDWIIIVMAVVVALCPIIYEIILAIEKRSEK